MNAHYEIEGKRTVRLFRNGRSQAVRIPKEFEFEGEEVIISKEASGKIVIEPVRKPRTPKELIGWLRSQPPLDEVWEDVDDSDLPPLDDIKL